VATPLGIREIVPSSFIAMPVGFRAQYFSKRRKVDSRKSDNVGSRRHRHYNENSNTETSRSVDMGCCHDRFDTTFSDCAHIAHDRNSKSNDVSSSFRGSTYSSPRRNLIWRHQVDSTAIAAHPLRMRLPLEIATVAYGFGTSESTFIWQSCAITILSEFHL
jgi:hypothetical protein